MREIIRCIDDIAKVLQKSSLPNPYNIFEYINEIKDIINNYAMCVLMDSKVREELMRNEELKCLEWRSPQPLTHEEVLSQDNPLCRMAYWKSTDGKNLDILSCLRWALTHLNHCQNELPCKENTLTKVAIETAISLQEMRHKLRSEQGVLGTYQSHSSDQIIVQSH
jgi:hypothetical protein